MFERLLRVRVVPLLLLLFVTSVRGDDTLWQLLDAREGAAGAFVQELYDEEGELLERATGRYAVLRPHFFRWEIEYPDRQLIVAAGDTLWHYDIDLATATRRTAADSALTPLALLGRDIADLQQRFSVEDLGDQRYLLRPNYPEAGFSSVTLAWRGGEVAAMDVVDRSGQLLRLSLTPDADSAALTPGDFVFEAPPGVEVFGAQS
jgi:chaperone LolA